jgi:hypothetical protein
VARQKDQTFDPKAYALLEPKKSQTAELVVDAMLGAARARDDEIEAAEDMARAAVGAAS